MYRYSAAAPPSTYGGGGVAPSDRWTFGGWNTPLRREHVSVSGAEVVDWLVQSGGGGTRPEAAALAQRLMDAGLLSSLTASKPFADSPDLLFRLADHAAVGRCTLCIILPTPPPRLIG